MASIQRKSVFISPDGRTNETGKSTPDDVAIISVRSGTERKRFYSRRRTLSFVRENRFFPFRWVLNNSALLRLAELGRMSQNATATITNYYPATLFAGTMTSCGNLYFNGCRCFYLQPFVYPRKRFLFVSIFRSSQNRVNATECRFFRGPLNSVAKTITIQRTFLPGRLTVLKWKLKFQTSSVASLKPVLRSKIINIENVKLKVSMQMCKILIKLVAFVIGEGRYMVEETPPREIFIFVV